MAKIRKTARGKASKRTVGIGKKRATKAPTKATKPTTKATKPPQKTTRKPTKKTAAKSPKASQFKSPYLRAASNPFRSGSAYSIVYDCLAHAGSEGISRQQLVSDVARICRIDERHSGFNCSVLLSARENGERHQSCRGGFWVEKINDHLRLHVTAPTTAGK